MPPNLRSTAVYLYEATSLCVRSFLRCQVVLRCTKHHSRGSGQYTSSGQTPQQSTAYGDDALRTLLKDRHTRVHAASQRMLAKGHEGHWRHQFKGRGAPPRSPAPHKKKLAEVEAERGIIRRCTRRAHRGADCAPQNGHYLGNSQLPGHKAIKAVDVAKLEHQVWIRTRHCDKRRDGKHRKRNPYENAAAVPKKTPHPHPAPPLYPGVNHRGRVGGDTMLASISARTVCTDRPSSALLV